MPHLHDRIDFTVEVFIVYKNTVLLRKHDKYGIWLSVGGHVELDEDPNQAVLREAKEEVGLEIILDTRLRPATNADSNDYKELIPPYFLNRHRVSVTHEHVTMTYFARSTTNIITESGEDEQSSGFKWYSRKALEQDANVTPRVKFYALKALEILSE
jgi:ADP-ribose pyrophosphatase YjhB (NUDIX family)